MISRHNHKFISGTILTFFLLFCGILPAQTHTNGLLSVDHSRVQDGYTLIYPHNQGNLYLLNNCGEIVHSWTDTSYLPANSARLMTDGSVFITKGKADLGNPRIKGGGGGGKIEHRDWDNKLIWEYTYNDSLKRMHHDFTVLPNGNVIFIAWEVKSFSELIAAGRDTNLLNDCKLWIDHLIEIKPEGKSGGTVVWEWHAWDHLIQDHDAGKKNYGNVAEHPELIDLNYFYLSGFPDWLHMNCIDYNAERDQLLLSVPTFSEIWIIDHSTSRAEAASHSGGQSGRGGDLLFRWGNPKVYRQGKTNDAQIGYQHDAHWMQYGISDSSASGKIMLFSNRHAVQQSAVIILQPDYDTVSHSYRMKSGRYLPQQPEWIYAPENPVQLYSETSSSAQRLPNGNTFVCSGRTGYIFESDPQGRIVWEYIVPLDNGSRVPQGYRIPPSANINFRVKKYPADFPAFSGRDLAPQGFIEVNPDTAFCNPLMNTASGMFSHLHLHYESVDRQLSLTGFLPQLHYHVTLTDMQGKIIATETICNLTVYSPLLPEREDALYHLLIVAEGAEIFELSLLK